MNLVRAKSGGVRRFFSPYLASAFLMFFGGYHLLYQAGSNPYREITYIFLTQFGYQILLVVLAAYLFRRLKLIEDTFLLLAVFGIFLMDVLLVQHLYGWFEIEGISWAVTSCISSLILLFSASSALGLNPMNRMTVAIAFLICFFRLGPCLLVHNQLFLDISFSYVGLSWLFALCLLPVVFLPEATSKFDSVSADVIEKAVLPVAFGFGLIHFLIAGNSVDLRFETIYLAPCFIILPAAMEKLFWPYTNNRKKIFTLISALGLFFAASKQSVPVYDIFGIGEGPLTPFWFTLVASAAIFWYRSFSNHSPGLLHFSALTLCMSFLGGNLSEVLVNIFYPQLWHVLFVTAICISVSFYTKLVRSSIWLNLLPSLVMASWLAQWEIPITAGFLIFSALSALLIESSCRLSLLPRVRMAIIAFALMTPLALLIIEQTIAVKILFAVVCFGFLARGFLFHQPFYLWPAIVATVVAAVIYPLAIQMHSGASTGRVLIQLAFILLLLGFANSIYGSRIGEFIKRTFPAPSA